MISTRLDVALSRGLLAWPEDGRIAVVGAPEGADLSALPKARTHVIARHFPAFDFFEKAGFVTLTAPDGHYAMTVLSLPRAKAEARQALARALEMTDGPVVVDGAKTDGIDAFYREVRKRGEVSEALSKAHGKLFVVEGGDFADWAEPEGDLPAGAFSADGPDPGSEALLAALPDKLSGRIVDLGSGWGFLAQDILTRDAVTRVDLVEADAAALAASKERITDDRASFHWADARSFRPGAPADHAVTNPPFHQGRRAEPELGRAFIRAAGTMLAPSGTLWLVANRHLPYEQTLKDTFAEVSQLDGPQAYKLFRAKRPKHPFRKG